MVSIEDKGCYNYGAQELSSANNNTGNFEFHRGNGKGRASQHRTALGKPTPSKWDDAQKWLVGLSRSSERNQSKTQPRNSNADDRRLIAPVPQVENGYSSGEDERKEENGKHYKIETKKVDGDESVWRSNKQMENSRPAVKSICLRDMGTDMTPIASQEPSRAATPIRTRTPANQSPIRSEQSTPANAQNGVQGTDSYQTGPMSTESRDESLPSGRGSDITGWSSRNGDAPDASKNTNADQERKLSPLETRAMAWDEAERAKYMARYKREEIKIEAWENHEKRKAEMDMKRMEVKAERMKSRAQEKLANKLAATKRIAEEKRSNAEAKLSEQAARISEMADYIRRTGHLPSSFSFKLPSCRSCCW